MKKLTVALCILVVAIAACKTSKTNTTTTVTTPVKPALECATPNASFATDIKPIFEQYCTKCHGNAGGYNFTKFSDVTRAAKNGDLLGTIKWKQGFPKMPAKAEQLDQNTINKIECWINNGLKP